MTERVRPDNGDPFSGLGNPHGSGVPHIRRTGRIGLNRPVSPVRFLILEVIATSLKRRIGTLEDRIGRATGYQPPPDKQLEVCVIDEFDLDRWDRLPGGSDARFDAERGALVLHPDSPQARAILEADFIE